jgi:transposase
MRHHRQSTYRERVWEPSEDCLGIDIGDKESSWCHVGSDNRVIQSGRIQTSATAIRLLLERRRPARVVIENGPHARWIKQVIDKGGWEGIVANPRQLRYISRSSNKYDEADAEKLARLGRLDPQLLHPIELRSDEQQADLSVIRVRRQLVETRVALAHQARGIVKSTGARLPAGRSGSWEAWVERCSAAVGELGLTALQPLMALMAELNKQIALCDQRIDELAEHKYPETQTLTTMPAVGNLTALTFVLTLANAERFADSRDVGPYLGMRPRRFDSGEKQSELRITKEGDPYLRTLLVQCAQHYLMPRSVDNDVRRWGLKLSESGAKKGTKGKKRAIVAVARKLAVILHRMWSTGERFRPFASPHAQGTMLSMTAD